MARTIRSNMNVRDKVFTPIDLINAVIICYPLFLWNKPIVSVYGSNNPLAEITREDYLH
jgi:hypothetical protein